MSKFEFVKSEQSKTSTNVIDIWFTDSLEFHDFGRNGELVLKDVSGNFGDYDKNWYLDKENYAVGTTGPKAYLRFNVSGKNVPLKGLTYTIEYNVQRRYGKEILSGTTTVTL